MYTFRYEKVLAQSNQTQGKLLSEENRDLDLQRRVDELETNRKDTIENFSRLNKENQAVIDKLNKEVTSLAVTIFNTGWSLKIFVIGPISEIW